MVFSIIVYLYIFVFDICFMGNILYFRFNFCLFYLFNLSVLLLLFILILFYIVIDTSLFCYDCYGLLCFGLYYFDF